MQLVDLVKELDVEKPQNLNVEITGIEYDSRNVKPGNVFIAIEGYITDGHNYISDAIKNGAVAVVMQKNCECEGAIKIVHPNTRRALAQISATFYGYPSKKLKLIGVTGTNGKTTVTYLIKSILEFGGYKVGLIGTNQNMIGETVIESERTTPEAPELNKLFHMMAKEGVDYVLMEVSSHSLELDRVYGLEFAYAAFTNLTQDHLDFHKSMDLYSKAKAKLFFMCYKGIVNADDDYVGEMTKNISGKIIKYGINKKSDIYAQNIKYTQRGVRFDVETPFGRESIRLNIPGEFSVYNALAAIGVCQSAGMGISDIAKALVLAKGVRGRAEVVNIPTDYTVMIDYAHTPDGLENIIKTVKGFAKGRVITLFGCGGDRDATKRPLMGEVAGNLSDFCIVTSDNPRSEDPEKIIEDILKGMKNAKAPYEVIVNRKDAIRYAMENAKENDIIILAGKGHETYQILKDGVIAFDEREIVKEILADIISED